MKTFVLAIAAAMTWLCASVATAQWPTATYDARTWEWQGGVRIMDRPGTDQNLNLVTDALTNQVLFNSNDATDLESSAGAELRFLRRNCYGTEWEFRGFFNNWETNTLAASANNIESPFFAPIRNSIPRVIPVPGDVLNVTSVTFNSLSYNYTSEIFNLELNMKKAVYPGVTLLVGPRFMYLEDQLSAVTTGSINGVTNTLGPLSIPFNQTTRIETENPLIGLQVGADFHVPLSRYLYLTGFVKAGGYGNTARATVSQSSSLVPGAVTSTFRRSQGSFVGEVGGKMNMDLVPGVISVFAGYEAMWLDNVAIAPVQLLNGGVNGAFNQVQMTGTPFVHGLTFGATIRR